ncbi:hypothetical protein D9M71_819690 [compost metagenome]
MNAIWTYDDGHLVARSKDGNLLRKWLADEVMGRGLAVLLNQTGDLSRLLLWPHLEESQAQI